MGINSTWPFFNGPLASLAVVLIQHRLRDRFPTLGSAGVAVEDFPTYRSDTGGNQHRHDVCYLSLLVAGQAQHQVGDEVFSEGPGSLVVVPAGVAHRIDTHGFPVHVINCYLDLDRHGIPPMTGALRGCLARFLPLVASRILPGRRLTATDLPEAHDLVNVFTRMAEEQLTVRPGRDLMLGALLREALVLIARRLHDQGMHGPIRSDAVVESACTWMAEHLDHALEVADITTAIATSRAALTRRFLAVLGVTPMAHLMALRLEEAAARLRDGDERVGDIALACGFKDLGHFARRFRSAYGATPEVWRRTLRGPR